MRGKEAEKTPGHVSSESGLISAFLGENAIQRNEHNSNVIAFRRGSTFGAIAWALFGLTDIFVVQFVEPGRLWFYLTMRAIGMLAVAIVALRLHIQPIPSPGMLRFLDTFAFVTCSAMVSITCVEFRGIASPLALGIITIIVCRTALVPDKWQRGLVPIGLTAAAHPAVLLLMTLVSPTMMAQLGDPRAVGGFIFNQLFIFGAATIGVIGSHKMWALRRQVYEARSLGRYKLKKRIGRGGMGEVWVAHHNTLGRDVAIKILRPDKMDDEAVVRFEREVKATSELSHPNTVRVFDFGVTEDGLCYYAMELLSGQDLSSLVKRFGPLYPGRVAEIGLQTAKALSEAHNRGIIHRDLKPGNLILTQADDDAEHVKVVDFGLALSSSSEHDSAVTNTGFIVGTPAYIAPELLSGRPADARSDIYALGAVMYELLSGFPPFYSGDSRRSLMLRSKQEVPRPSDVLGEDLPPDLEALVLQCLRKDPDERYQTAKNLIDALRSCSLEYADELVPEERNTTDDVQTIRRLKEKARAVQTPHRQARAESGIVNPFEEDVPDEAPIAHPGVHGADPDKTDEMDRPSAGEATDETDDPFASAAPDTIVENR